MELGVSYISTHLPDHIRADMRYLKEIGCTEVLFALQENHIEILTGAVRFGAGIAKDCGLRPYAVVWGYANTFGGGRMSRIMLDNMDMWRRHKNGTPMPKACLNNPKVIDKFIEITEICRTHGFEGMFVDEPSVQECFCKNCRDVFYRSFTGKLTDSVGTEEYRKFQRDTVRAYTGTLCKRIKMLDQSLKTIACIMPSDRECFEAVASIRELDVFGTDPYWLLPNSKMDIEDACGYAKLVKNMCNQKNKSSQIWLNCWGIPAGREKEIYTGGKRIAEVQCDSLYTWSFRGGLGTSEECVDPQEAWNSVVELYKELSQ